MAKQEVRVFDPKPGDKLNIEVVVQGVVKRGDKKVYELLIPGLGYSVTIDYSTLLDCTPL